jgi:hypothetical protein
VLVIAKEYGTSPQEVEQWDLYWFNRAVLKLRADNVVARREANRRKKNNG